MRDDDSAFPASGVVFVDSYDPGIRERVASEARGMKLRDYFAAKAMQAIFHAEWTGGDLHYSDLARRAYQMADFMIVERAK